MKYLPLGHDIGYPFILCSCIEKILLTNDYDNCIFEDNLYGECDECGINYDIPRIVSTIKVVNKRIHGDNGEYIARPSCLGNKYTHLNTSKFAENIVDTRQEAIFSYRKYLEEQLKSDTPQKQEMDRLYKKYIEERQLTLVCWCFPKACHGSVIRELLLIRSGEIYSN